MARPQKPIDWLAVEKLCAIHCTEEEIAQFLGVTTRTLRRASKRDQGMSFVRYYREKRGAGKASLRRAQWQLAQKGNATMLIWLGKQHLDQEDKNSHKHSTPPGQPFETRAVANLTDEELDAKIAALSGNGSE